MRTKLVAEEAVNLYDVGDDERAAGIATVSEDERVLILSADEEAVLNVQGVANDAYYDAKRAFVLGGRGALDSRLRSFGLDDEQQRALFELITAKEVKR